ncbi:energy-coupling factor ABC transporter ATP-binding protein [bacterium]|nr:energy-coupling factor ABC transporter ATP-binding protein [bacterium]MBU1983193.1 energy-coupling factor ABC transporter ATP-binding protein [bacterium]
MSELVARDISFGYRGCAPLLKDVSLTLYTGRSMVVIGRNGSGKTTLLRILAGLLPPVNGQVLADGQPIVASSGRVGIVLQNPDHQMIASTVEEEIALGLELRGRDPGEMKPVVESLLERFGLQSLRLRPPEALSGGQKQRVALAAALAAKPDFLLFDEPDSFLDAPSRAEFMRSLDELRAECGILWVTPRPLRMPAADEHLLLENGTLIERDQEDFRLRMDGAAV